MAKERIFNPDHAFHLAENADQLRFLYRKCSMSEFCLNCWLESEEFVSQMISLKNNSELIDDGVILGVAEPIFEEKYKNRTKEDKFQFNNARRGLNQLRRAIENGRHIQ